jgi:glycosyltransferase involved in cell wall biosynthesis
MVAAKEIKLVLFFTRGVSLGTWDKIGMFDREVEIYRRLQQRGVKVSFVTYGDATEQQYEDRVSGVRIYCNKWRLPEKWYIRSLYHLQTVFLRGSTIYKSNQVQGADIAMRAAKLRKKKFIARCGYLYSEFMEHEYGVGSYEAKEASALERRVFDGADRVVVTTAEMRYSILSRYQIPASKVTVIPNYVETDIFCPGNNGQRSSNRICFVGRFEEQKNPFALLKAVEGLDVELLMVGSGSLARQLRDEAGLQGLQVQFFGNLPHRQLPKILKSSSLFVLPSHYEGHPKTLLEAMACGLPVIGTNVPGIREVIQHRYTGYLCGDSPEEIRAAIQEVMANAELRSRMGRNAREFVVVNFSLDRVFEMELALLRELAV